MPTVSSPRPRPRPAGGRGGDPPGALLRPPRRRGGPAAAGRGAATSTPRRRRAAAAALALALGLGLLFGLLPAGGPAGAAAQAPVQPPVAPPAPLAAAPRAEAPEAPEAAGKAKKLAKCAAVTATSATCKAKKGGAYLVMKDPTIIWVQHKISEYLTNGLLVENPAVPDQPDQPDSAAEEPPLLWAQEPDELSPKRFAKQYAKTYPSGAGPTANVTFAGQSAAAANLDGVGFKKTKAGKEKLRFKVDPGDREALAALDPGACVVTFRSRCEDAESESECTYSDQKCTANATCPGGTLVSAECADRSAFAENPCACTALQQLAGLSGKLKGQAPWNDLANKAYCNPPDLDPSKDCDFMAPECLSVDCATVDGVKVPTYVVSMFASINGALPPSLGDLGPSFTALDLNNNAISSLPTEIALLKNLDFLDLSSNNLPSVPSEIAELTKMSTIRLNSNNLSVLPSVFRHWPVRRSDQDLCAFRLFVILRLRFETDNSIDRPVDWTGWPRVLQHR